MLITFQFPIIDFRGLRVKKNQNKLPIDGYLNSENGMIRNFGKSHPSVKESKNTIPSYGSYFEAKNLVRFHNKLHEFDPATEGTREISRRYYYDGISAGRFEISLANTIEGELSIDRIRNIISKYAKLPVKIDLGKRKNKKEHTLIESIHSITKAYYDSTLEKKDPDDSNVKSLVKSGRPICIVQLNWEDRINFDTDFTEKIEINKGQFNLYYFVMNKLNCLKVYVLEPVSDGPLKNLNDFRYAISRIHVEKENIFSLYDFIEKEKYKLPTKDDDFKKRIIGCINKLQEGLLFDKRFGIEINEIVKLAFKVENEIEYDSIKKAISHAETIADKYSITQMQLLFSEVDFKKIVYIVNKELDSGKYSEKPEEYKLLEKLKLEAEKRSKHRIVRILEVLKIKFRINIKILEAIIETK